MRGAYRVSSGVGSQPGRIGLQPAPCVYQVRRPKGVETHHLLRCRSCEMRVAYRSAAVAPTGPWYLYVPPEAVSLSNRVAPASAAPTAPIAPTAPPAPPALAAAAALAAPAPAMPAPPSVVTPPILAADAGVDADADVDADVDGARHAKRARVEEPVAGGEECTAVASNVSTDCSAS